MENIHANTVGIIKKDIYIIKNDINNKVYIGQSLNVKERFRSHCKKSNNDNSIINKAIQKYGKSHFWYEILERNITNYNEREKYWIQYYDSLSPNGYNIGDGGELPPTFFGNDHPNTVISDENVVLLKDDLKNTRMSLSQLAHKYNISKRQVQRINDGLSRSSLNEKYPIRRIPNPIGKLTEKQVDEIIELLRYTYRFDGDIARQYGVVVHVISGINNGTIHRRDSIQYPIRKWKSSGVILFTYEQVTDIIEEILFTDHSLNQIAKKYHVSFGAIANICSGSSKKYRRDNLKYPLRPF